MSRNYSINIQELDYDKQYENYRDMWQDILSDDLEEVISDIVNRKGYYHNDRIKALNHSITHLNFLLQLEELKYKELKK